MKNLSLLLILTLLSTIAYTQNQPQLGVLQSFGLFSGGILSGSDSIIVHGDLGYHSSNDTLLSSHNTCDLNCPDFQQLLNDIDTAQVYCSSLTGTILNSNQLADTTFLPGIYSINGNLRLSSQITLQADSDSIFIFNISDTLFCSYGLSLILIDVNPKNIYFNVGKSLIAFDDVNISGIILVKESSLLGNNFSGIKALLCSGNVTTQGISGFYSCESLMSPYLKNLFFGKSCGLNYVQKSVPINQRNVPGTTSCTTVGYIQPVTINITLPSSYSVVKAYLWYASVATPAYAFPQSTQIQLNTNSVTANLINEDPGKSICWGPNGYSHTGSYRADVTSLITGSGNYIVSNIPIGNGVDPNGVTLFIIYIDNNNLQQQGTLMLYDGLFVNEIGGGLNYAETISNNGFMPGNNLIPSESKTLMLIADIESVVDPINNFFVFNNQSIGINAACNLPYSQMWQMVTTQPTFYSPNQTSVTLYHEKPGSDCYALIALGAYHATQTSECHSFECAGPDKFICEGSSVTLTACPANSYLWSNGSTTQSITVNPQNTTTYTLTVTPGPVTDNVTVFVNPNPPAPVVYGNTDGCTSNGNFDVLGANSMYTYSYTATIGGITTSGFGTHFIPIVTQNPKLGGSVTFIASTSYGCQTTTTVVIEACCEGLQIISSSMSDNISSNAYWHLFYPFNSGTAPQQQGGFYVLNPTISGSGPYIHPGGGTFTVDQNLEMQYTDFILFYNQQVVIEPGRTLKISRSSTVKNCTWMWDKILIKTGAHLIIEDNSAIEGGIISVYAETGSDFQIQDAFFRNNYIGIHCESGSFASSFIKNTEMRCNLNSGFLFFPYANEKSLKHIDLNQVSAMDIGDAGSLQQTNIFDGARFGIYAIKSSFNVKNCRFSNITNTGGILSGHGLFADAQSGTNSINVGGTGQFDYNIFELSTSGIFVRNGYSVRIENNYFNNISPGSISCRVLNSKQINVDVIHNFFNGFGTGILIQNVEGSNVTLSQNYFNNAGTTEGTYAIKLFNAILPSQPNNTTVSGNLARNLKRSGFWLTNYPYAQINGVNTIEFEVAAPSSGSNNNQVKWGMKIQNSAKVQVLENYVLRPSLTPNGNNPTSAFDNKRYGISVETSYLNTISSNNIIKLGTGIRYFNATTNIITCNDLFHNRIGVSLEGSNIGDQGDNSNSQDNKWNIYSGRLWDIRSLPTLPLSNPNWHSQSANYPWTPDPLFIDPPGTIGFPYSPSTSSCTNPCPNCRQEEMYRIVTEDGDYALLTEDEIYVLKKEVFLEIQLDSIWVNMNTSFDQPLQAFYDSTLQTSMGQLNLVQNLIPSDTTEAKTLVSIIQPRNHFEENERIVYEIYLATWSRGIEELTATQYDALLTIAFENPISGGPAVYTARVMLDVDIDDFIPENGRLSQQGINSSLTKPIGKVYPNPTTDIVNYRLILLDYSDVVIVLEDIYGRTINKFKYSDKNGILRISIANYQQGIYTLKAYKRNELINSQKIVKVN